MALTNAQKLKLGRQWVRQCYQRLAVTANLPRDEIEAAADALEAFIVSNATAINNALPPTFRGAATTPQKRVLLALVAVELAGLGALDGDE
jgi:hypothetical protein